MSEWPRYYILVDRLPVAVDHDTWMRWFETSDRQIGDDKIGKTRVSTVFLGIDHNFYGSSGPLLFQSLIFDGPLASEMWRYATYGEAERGPPSRRLGSSQGGDQSNCRQAGCCLTSVEEEALAYV